MIARKLLPVAALLISACTYMNPATLLKLSRFDPLDTDPGELAVQLRRPDGIDVAPKGVRLRLSADWPVQSKSFSNSYVLERRGDIFFVSDGDLPDLRRDLALAKDWNRQDDRGVSGSLSVDVTACKTNSEMDPDATLSVLLSTDGGQTMIPFLMNVPLSKTVSAEGSKLAETCA